ncbi:MAG: VCBS repeat-containing protein [Saprospiraceae bacterium]|nr:VCBS repeat-containing protein [Saprospiraceae bacterium]
MDLKYKCFYFFIATISLLKAQPTFTNKTVLYKNQLQTRSVMPGAALDIDGDLIDDLMILDKGNVMKLVKSTGKNFGLSLLDTVKTTSSKEWTLAAGDINNDGFNELILAGEYNLGSIISIKNYSFSRKTFNSGIYAQGSNIVDINNDGWLDYFVCNDDGPNKIYLNDGAGNLSLTNIIDFSLNDPTDGSGNYGSEWVDVNGDLLPDLCISKCRAGVEDPSDQRRINRLYINKGNTVFEEKGAVFGLNSGAQSWVTAFGDIDNDGDQDAFVVNHYSPHELMENINGNSFKKITMPISLSSFSFQAIMRDFDNDGWVDILLTGVEGAILMHNKGDKTFDIIKDIIGPTQARSMICGDFNDDGFIDIHAHLGEPINDVGPTDDQIWLNQPNNNHYIKLNLQGRTSNISAIGAQLELYGTWGKQVRYIKGGESYGIFNSFQQIFGLGNSNMSDSLLIKWPSGIIDKYTNVEGNNTYYIQEGKCMTQQMELYEDVLIAKDTTVGLNALPGFATYQWNSGTTNPNLQVNNGTYHVSMTDTNGCVTISKPIVVISGCFEDDEKLLPSINNKKLCQGSILEIYPIPAAEYKWQDGSSASFFEANETGWISLTASDYCGNTKKDSVYVDFVNINWLVKGDTVTQGKPATLTSNHPNTHWFELPDFTNPIYIGDTLITEPLELTKVYGAKAIENIDVKINNVGEKVFPSSNFYGSNTTAGNMIFNVEKNCIIHAIQLNTDTEGLRRIIITNNINEVIFSKDIILKPGITKVILDANLKPGLNYRIRTDENINESSLGFKSPRLVRTFSSTNYPYTIENTLSIVSSSFGSQYFMYFYNWEVHHDFQTCESDLLNVVAFVEKESAIQYNETNPYVTIYPNPAQDNLQILLDKKVQYAYISNLRHQEMMTIIKGDVSIDVSDWPIGMYILTLVVEDTIYHMKWVKL